MWFYQISYTLLVYFYPVEKAGIHISAIALRIFRFGRIGAAALLLWPGCRRFHRLPGK
jgi:hypothetical protein